MAATKKQSQGMYDHFSEVAASYNDIRTTDLEPVLFIKDTLGERKSVRAADIGCGGGRYSLLLFQHLSGLQLTCNDVNESMVAETARYLADHGVENFSTVKADITNLQLPDGALDAMLTFNAIHHFDPNLFLSKAAKTLTEGGYVIIYTRLQSQNVRNIWGRYFPAFAEKENRLYRLSDIESWKEESGSLRLASINFFKYRRRATLSLLLRQAHSKHYSTFSLYSAAEFDRAAVDFERNIKQRFSNPDRVEWSDENVMIVFKKGPHDSD
ncbi:MAG: class I SAM-dependent methyltransferase [Acidiferrobacterales bacterium]